MSSTTMLKLTSVKPSSTMVFEIESRFSLVFTSKDTLLIGLLNRSVKDPIFWTLILLNLFSSFDILLTKVNNNELPSFKISRFNSRISEKINISKTLLKSVNFNTAYELPFAVFLSWTFNKVAAIFASLTSSLELKLEYSIIL